MAGDVLRTRRERREWRIWRISAPALSSLRLCGEHSQSPYIQLKTAHQLIAIDAPMHDGAIVSVANQLEFLIGYPVAQYQLDD